MAEVMLPTWAFILELQQLFNIREAVLTQAGRVRGGTLLSSLGALLLVLVVMSVGDAL